MSLAGSKDRWERIARALRFADRVMPTGRGVTDAEIKDELLARDLAPTRENVAAVRAYLS